MLLSLLFEIYVAGVTYSPYFAYLIDNENWGFSALTIVCFLASVFLFYFFIRNALLSSTPLRVFTLIVLGAALFVEYGYEKALGRFSNLEDLQTAFATTREQQTAAITMYVNAEALVPWIVLLSLFIAFRPAAAEGPKTTVGSSVGYHSRVCRLSTHRRRALPGACFQRLFPNGCGAFDQSANGEDRRWRDGSSSSDRACAAWSCYSANK